MITRIITGIFLILLVQACEPEQSTPYVPEETCSDGILNQGETETDCGGPCPACSSRMSATVNGIPWQAQGNITSSTNNGSILILSGNGNSTMSMIHSGPFATGTYTLNSAIYQDLPTLTNYFATTGSITFTVWDTRQNVVSGTFSFTAVNPADTSDKKVVAGGEFKHVPF
jgi:hypothetical protein